MRKICRMMPGHITLPDWNDNTPCVYRVRRLPLLYARRSGRHDQTDQPLDNEITTMYPDLRSVLAETLAGRPAVFDGELVVLGQDGRPDFQLMQSRHQRGPTAELLRTAPVTYIVFDLLRLGEQVLVTTPYTRRRELLADLPVSSPRVAVPRHFTAEDIDPNELLAVVEEQQLEGLVAKRLKSRYHSGQTQPGLDQTTIDQDAGGLGRRLASGQRQPIRPDRRPATRCPRLEEPPALYRRRRHRLHRAGAGRVARPADPTHAPDESLPRRGAG